VPPPGVALPVMSLVEVSLLKRDRGGNFKCIFSALFSYFYSTLSSKEALKEAHYGIHNNK
jgi:hypothetical protein